ncbi:hypothetical protein E6W36_02985 [Hankyongella ginsenosidimutans]|uniref:Molecular chaperone DnaJ n=1 Tax=Hankyongella ginsenosidimutans TaxID=1763828 RepID=A0A4D7C5P0_9SPHN|nr:hypothetical protein [Hankyongella ginsenosidimutans]QCI78935.1 hypothetical protein E6W36_02985 [Hankyongella ginsenosidimutans]
MIPLLLAAAALAVAWAGLPWLARARPRDVKRLVYTLAGLALALGVAMVMTGRGGVLLPIVAAIAAGLLHRLLNRQPPEPPAAQPGLQDAYALLGLPEAATPTMCAPRTSG